MDNVVRILIVEDLPSDADLAKREITATLSSCVFEVVETQEDYLAAIERFQPDLIVSDYKMPHFDGLTAMKLAQQHAPMVPFIILTGSMNEETAVECMKAGATDYVIKEHIKRLGLAVVSALEQKRLRLEKERTEAEERAAQNALRESEERYRSFFDNSIDAVLLTSPDGSILKANAEACRIFGYTEEGLCQVGRNGVVDPSDPRLPDALEERNRTGKFKGELTLVRKDGTKFPGEISTAVFKDKDGAIRTSMIIRDITERKRAEEALRENEEKFRTLAETIASGILIYQGNRFVYANRTAESVTGFTQGELQQMDFWERVHPDYQEIVRERGLRRQRGEMVPSHYEIKFFNKKGEERWVDTATGYTTINGKSAGLITFFDITERKRTEEALRESEERYRQLVELSPEAIFVHIDGKFVYINPAATKLFNLSAPEEVIGKSVFDFYHPDYHEVIRGTFETNPGKKETY